MNQNGGNTLLIATMGFTVDFIIRRIADIKREENVHRLMAVGLDAGDGMWRRVEQTYSLLSTYLTSINVESSLHRLEITPTLIPEARDIIALGLAEAGEGDVELFLTGGPRMLVVAMLLAAMSLRGSEARRIRVVSYGEGFPGSIKARLHHITVLHRLDDKSRAILEALREGSRTPDELRRRTGLKRSTLYMKLEDLRREGLIVSEGRGRWSVHPDLVNYL
ncbi:MAG: CRISPR-associated CARF protein Csa3 [Aeropyrum sp.]|nr:CRISPR-associated CARF protein Csa3 [Aeropyrum sp.]